MTSINETVAESNPRQAKQFSLNAGFFMPVENSLHSSGVTVIYDGGYGVEVQNKGLITLNMHPTTFDRRKPAIVSLIEAIAVITNSGFISETMEKVMSKQLTADFHGTSLAIVEHNNQPYISAKQITEAIGLDWKGQYVKLNHNRDRWSMEKISMVAPDGKQRSTVCLPLRKLPGWLMTIQPNKLSNELRPRIIQYQTECDDILWQHWENAQQQQPAIQPPQSTLDHYRNQTTHSTTLNVVESLLNSAAPSEQCQTITIYLRPGDDPVIKIMEGKLSVFPNHLVREYANYTHDKLRLDIDHIKKQTEFLSAGSIIDPATLLN